ncbi:hypothetical protein F4859DRAFT_530090 [Xylaria cf. heliscus]|nr:hypothetical protein F4859DRAFT_530090 [Xylaria cf. heliscus]
MEMVTWIVHSETPFLGGYDNNDNECNFSGANSNSSKASNKWIKFMQTSETAGIFKRGEGTRKSTEFTIQDGITLADYCNWMKDYSVTVARDAFNAFARVSNALTESSTCRCCSAYRSDTLQSAFAGTALDPSARGENSTMSQVGVDDLRKLNVKERWVNHVLSIREVSELDELPPLEGKGIPGEWRANRDWRECPQNPWIACERQVLDTDARITVLFPGSLVFNTTVAPLKIGQPSTHANSKGGPNVTDAFLLNSNDENVGILRTMDRGWQETHGSKDGIQRLFEFVVIPGRLQEYNKRKISAWLERLPCKRFVARRVGVGTAKMCRWKDCSPRWEMVFFI